MEEISLAKFLSRYLLLGGKDLSKMTHEEVKWLFPDLKRATFDMIEEDPSLVCRGDVILVNDGKKTIPYFVPEVRTDEIEEIDEVSVGPKQKVVKDDTYYDYTSMSIYELRCLLDRKFNSIRNQRCARRELDNRGACLKKKYRRVEEKRKWKKEEDY